jgi:hypothetical protein
MYDANRSKLSSVDVVLFLDAQSLVIILARPSYSLTNILDRLLIRFDVVGASAELITTLFVLAAMTSGGWAGWAGLTITSAMSLTLSVYWACRFITQLELDLK